MEYKKKCKNGHLTYTRKQIDLVDLYKIVYFYMIKLLQQRQEYVWEVFVLELHVMLSTRLIKQ